jgi:transposase-like protein
MSWECKTMSELREEFAIVALNSANFSAVCRDYGITRKTGYKWLKRYE